MGTKKLIKIMPFFLFLFLLLYCFPVVSAGTFGRISGDTWSDYHSVLRSAVGSPVADGFAISCSMTIESGSWTSGERVRMGLYWASNNTFYAETIERDSGGSGVQTFYFATPVPIYSGVSYYVTGMSESSAERIRVRYQSTSSVTRLITTYTYPNWPAGTTNAGSEFAFYCGYTIAPSLSNPAPNDVTGVNIKPICNITVNDLDADEMNVKFYENSTGSWVLRQTNSSVSNGTYRWNFDQASDYNTEYFWKVIADDGYVNTTEIYHFTTKVVNTPTFGAADPLNASINISLQPTLSINISDQDGDSLTLNWYTNESGSWIHRQTNSSCANGTYRYVFSGASNYSTAYYWRVTLYDGIHNISEIYHFTTMDEPIPPVIHNYTSVFTLDRKDQGGDLFGFFWAIPLGLIIFVSSKRRK